MKDKTIQSISIVSAPGEDAAFLNRAKGVIDRIIASQSVDVDTVSGATFSSKGILAAVKNALTGQETLQNRHPHQERQAAEQLRYLKLKSRLPTGMERITELERDLAAQ